MLIHCPSLSSRWPKDRLRPVLTETSKVLDLMHCGFWCGCRGGRPGGRRRAAMTTRAGSRCIVSRSQVRPFQMSRTAFSLTPNARATQHGLRLSYRLLESVLLASLILRISIACSAVRIALVLQAWIDESSLISRFFSSPVPALPPRFAHFWLAQELFKSNDKRAFSK